MADCTVKIAFYVITGRDIFYTWSAVIHGRPGIKVFRLPNIILRCWRNILSVYFYKEKNERRSFFVSAAQIERGSHKSERFNPQPELSGGGGEEFFSF